MAENLKKTLNIDGTDYNINAVYSDEAGKVTKPLTIKESGVEVGKYNGSVDISETTKSEINYVPADGGKFTGEVLLDNGYSDLGQATDESIINFKQINDLVSTLRAAPLHKWNSEEQQFDNVVDANNTLLRLNVVTGTSEDFNSESFKRFMCVPDLSNAENRYYGMTLGTLDTNTCAISSYKGTHTTVYIPSRGYPTTSADGTLKLSDCRTVTTIGRGAFKGNTTIEEVIIPESVTTIESEDSRGTFQSCTKLKSIKLPSGLTKINAHTFNGCTGLTEIVIGKKVAKISKNAFNNCSSLRKVYYEGTEEDWHEFVSTSTIDSSETKQIHSTGNTALTNVYTNSKNSVEGYEFIFNYKYTPDIRDLPCLFICADSGVETSNKMFLKMPDSGIFLDVTQGATRLDSTLVTSTNYYTYEGLAEIIARINLRLEALGSTDLALSNDILKLATVHSLSADDPILAAVATTPDIDPDAIPTVQSLDARLDSIETELGIDNLSIADTRLDAIEDGDTRVVKEARKVSNSLTIKLTDEAVTEGTDKFTYDGSVAKTVTIKTTDNDITLKEDLYTFAPIGVAQKASNYVIGSGNTISSSNPGKLGDSGDSLKDVFDRVFGTETPIQPSIGASNVKLTITCNPSTTTYKGPSNSTEFGAAVASQDVTYTIELSNAATVTYGYRCGSTKTTTSGASIYYPATKAYDSSKAQLKITLPTMTGVTIDNKYVSSKDTTNKILYCNFDNNKQVKFTVTLASANITTASQTRFGKVSAEATLGNAQTDNTVNATVTTTSSNIINAFLAYKPITKSYEDSSKAIDGKGIDTDGVITNSKNAINVSSGYVPYTYTLASALPSSLPTSNRTQSKPTSITVSGGSDSTYLYIFVPSEASISSLSAGPLAVPFTQVESSKSYAVNNGKTATYKVYKTVSTVKAETFTVA